MLRYLAYMVITVVLAASTARAAATQRPNVLFIIADDLTRSLGCYGHPTVKSPNVDRLASQGIRFDRAYCQYPVCSPSRLSFLSGRRPEHTGMYGNEGESRTALLKDAVFMPEYFKQQGYFTARVGKVFHIGRDVPECWDVTEEGTPANRIIYQPQEVDKLALTDTIITQGRLTGGGGEGNTWSVTSAPESKLIGWQIATRIVELIEQANKGDKPFFIACGFRRPHLPHLAPKSYFDGYPDDKVPMPERSPVIHPRVQSTPSDQDTRDGMRSYLACVTFMDTQLGRVLDTMDRLKLWDNTIVIMIGDNGYHLGSRGGYWGKGTGYDESCGVPMVVVAPGKAKSVACKRVVEYLDFYPTLVEMCGLPPMKGMEGRSIRPLLDNPQAPWDHAAFSIVARQDKPSVLAVSTEKYRLIENEDGKGGLELYDIQADPREWVNLASNPECAEAMAKMKQLARSHRQGFWK
jgi:uncharacterized sulfatase